MKNRFVSIVVILAMLAGFTVLPSPTPVQAAPVTLGTYAGITAYATGPVLDPVAAKAAFRTIEYQTTDFFIGYVDIPLYTPEYDPLVLVHSSGWIAAFHPTTDYAGKIVDVIGEQLDETLLEKAVKLVAGDTVVVSHYDFAHPDATRMLLIAEDKDDGNAFTLTLPSDNTYYAKSYGFYQSSNPSFTIDNDTIDQVSFVTTNADNTTVGLYGSIYGHFGIDKTVPYPDDGANTFAVWSDSLHAFGALAIEYEGTEAFVEDNADLMLDIALIEPAGMPTLSFDLTPSAPVKSDATLTSLEPVLSWSASTAPNYEYCVTTTGPACDTAWIATSETSVQLKSLFYETTYHWQVRAVNSFETVAADGGAWASFTTETYAVPVAFAKDDAVLVEKAGIPSKVILSWAESYGAYYYEYCLDTTAACTAPEVWHNVGLKTTVTVSNLAFDTTYSWQVRAVNYTSGGSINSTDANGGWFTFTTRSFGKLRPTSGELISYLSVPLEWEASAAAISYEYCVDKVLNTICDGSWVKVGTATKATLKQLALGTTYYWQVKAVTSTGEIFADGGTWWTFNTPASKKPIPSLFKVSPLDGAIDQGITGLALDWKDYKTFINYEFCFFSVDDTDTTPIADDDTCNPINPEYDTNWVNTGKTSTATLLGLANGTTYYWQVRVNVGTVLAPVYVYGDHGDYWSFTTVLP